MNREDRKKRLEEVDAGAGEPFDLLGDPEDDEGGAMTFDDMYLAVRENAAAIEDLRVDIRRVRDIVEMLGGVTGSLKG